MTMASIGNHDNDENDENEQQPTLRSRPAPPRVHRQNQPTLRAIDRDQPRVVRPHRTLQASTSRPIDIAQAETDRLVREDVPIRTQRLRLTEEEIEQISTTLLQYPKTMPNVIPIPIGQRDGNGEQLYLLSKRPMGQLGGYLLTMARLGPSGSGTVYHVDAAEKWSVMPYYLNYEEICYLQAAANDARGVGYKPEGA